MNAPPRNLWLGSVFLLLWSLGQVGAQAHMNRLSVPNDPTVRDKLHRAQSALEREDRDRAITIWQAVLDQGAAKVVAVHRAPRSDSEVERVVVAGDRFQGVRAHVMDLIQALPDDGIERYRQLMEPRAKRLLTTALRDSEEAGLRECARRFALTPSGRRAQVVLMDMLLEAGRFDEARVSVQALRNVDDDAKLAAREAWALWGTDRVAELRAFASASRAGFPGEKIVVRGERVNVSRFIEELSAGKKTRAPSALGELDLRKRAAWERSFSRNENSSDRWYYDDEESDLRFPVVPAVEGEIVYACDGLSLRARRLSTGTEIWPAVRSTQSDFDGRQNYSLKYHVVVDGGLVFAYLDGDPLIAHYWSRRWRAIPSHKLIAVDKETGRVQWSHAAPAGRDDEETAFLRKLSVNQPPVIVGDTVYAAGTILKGIFHHWLCAFERETGRLRWKTYIGAGQTALSRGGNPSIACVPGHVTEHRGVLYYGTNMGVFCAVDAVTGSNVWQSAYSQDLIPEISGGWGRRRYASQPEPTWQVSRPRVSGGKVFFAPNDSRRLYAAELGTGELRSIPLSTRRAGSHNNCFVGVHQGLLIFSGAGGLMALDLEDFRVRWASRLVGSLRGQAAVMGTELVFTTTGPRPEIHRCDILTGDSVERSPLRSSTRAGNVVLSPGAVVIGASDCISAYLR